MFCFICYVSMEVCLCPSCLTLGAIQIIRDTLGDGVGSENWQKSVTIGKIGKIVKKVSRIYESSNRCN